MTGLVITMAIPGKAQIAARLKNRHGTVQIFPCQGKRRTLPKSFSNLPILDLHSTTHAYQSPAHCPSCNLQNLRAKIISRENTGFANVLHAE